SSSASWRSLRMESASLNEEDEFRLINSAKAPSSPSWANVSSWSSERSCAPAVFTDNHLRRRLRRAGGRVTLRELTFSMKNILTSVFSPTKLYSNEAGKRH